MTIRSQVLAICLFCFTAYATGGDNTHSQGVSLAGRGLDAQERGKPAPWVPYFSASWPLSDKPTPYEAKLPNGDRLQILATCSEKLSPIPITDRRFAFCTGEVSLLGKTGAKKKTAACDRDDATTGSVNLLAIRGRWISPSVTNKFGGLQIGDNEFAKVVTFACAPTFPPGATAKQPTEEDKRRAELLTQVVAGREGGTGTSPSAARLKASQVPVPPDKKLPLDVFVVLPMTLVDQSNIDTSPNLGVLAKCYYWGFAKGEDDPGLRTYQACVRAARADYCGNGESHTQAGTKIQIYETPETQNGTPIKVSEESAQCPLPYLNWTPCFEAIWDQNRALCISHARYRQMPPNGCQAALFTKITYLLKEGRQETDKEHAAITLNCLPDTYNNLAGASFVKNRSGINNLDQKEVESCWNNILCP